MHKDRCLLYEAGEMTRQEAASFKAHLAACPGCAEWLKTIKKGHDWAVKAAVAPPAAVVTNLVGDKLARPQPPSDASGGGGGGGAGLGKWMRFMAISASLTAVVYVARKIVEPEGPAQPETVAVAPGLRPGRPAPEPAVPPPAPRVPPRSEKLAVHKAEDASVWKEAVPAVQGGAERSAPKLPSEIYPPKEPLDCDSAASVTAFKNYVLWGWKEQLSDPPGHMSDDWTAHICGEQSRSIPSTVHPVYRDPSFMTSACPKVKTTGDHDKDVETYWNDLLPVAVDFYDKLALTKPQALKLAAGYCGKPAWVDGE